MWPLKSQVKSCCFDAISKAIGLNCNCDFLSSNRPIWREYGKHLHLMKRIIILECNAPTCPRQLRTHWRAQRSFAWRYVHMSACVLHPGGSAQTEGLGSLIYQHYSHLEQSASDKSNSGMMDGERHGERGRGGWLEGWEVWRGGQWAGFHCVWGLEVCDQIKEYGPQKNGTTTIIPQADTRVNTDGHANERLSCPRATTQKESHSLEDGLPLSTYQLSSLLFPSPWN